MRSGKAKIWATGRRNTPRCSPWPAPLDVDPAHRRAAGNAVALALTWTLAHGPGEALVTLLGEVLRGMAAILLVVLWGLGAVTL